MRLNKVAILSMMLIAASTSAFGQVSDVEDQQTSTSKVELKRWFLEPASVDSVIQTSDQSNFLRAASFDPQSGTKSGAVTSQLPPQPPLVPDTIVPQQQPAGSGTTLPLPPFGRLPLNVQPPGAGSTATTPAPAAVPIVPLAPKTPSPVLSNPPAPTGQPPVVQQPSLQPSLQQPGVQRPMPPFSSPQPAQPGFAGSSCQTGQCMPNGVGFPTMMTEGGGPSAFGTGNTAAYGTPFQANFFDGNSMRDRSRSNWTIRAGALFLFRSQPNRQPMVFAQGQSIDASNFSFGLQTGWEGSATRHRAFGEWDFETIFFGIEDWSSLQSQLFAGDPITINNSTPTIVSGPRRVVSRYSSDLYNFEWNLKRPINQQTDFLFGVRHIQVNEQLNTNFRSVLAPPVPSEDYRITTNNRLYGLQIGLNRVLFADTAYQFEAYGKSGLYANDTRQSSSLAVLASPTPTLANDDRETDLAFVNEIGLRYRYRFTENINFHVGYRGLWIDGLSLASDQIPQTNFAGVNANIDNDGQLFYHGATVGLEIRF